MESKTYAPVGRCIYCGTTEGPLTTEHIIPYCMGGNLKLPEASCEEHRVLTQKLEERNFGQFLKPYRTKIGIQSSNPVPTEIEPWFKDADGKNLRGSKVPVDDFPESCIIPTYYPP
ncbi:MAG: hypothetical protein IT551_11465, partial [Novosphingobium sp.]|nr:hypothetical protein [Novosphingobium sp.]